MKIFLNCSVSTVVFEMSLDGVIYSQYQDQFFQVTGNGDTNSQAARVASVSTPATVKHVVSSGSL